MVQCLPETWMFSWEAKNAQFIWMLNCYDEEGPRQLLYNDFITSAVFNVPCFR